MIFFISTTDAGGDARGPLHQHPVFPGFIAVCFILMVLSCMCAAQLAAVYNSNESLQALHWLNNRHAAGSGLNKPTNLAI